MGRYILAAVYFGLLIGLSPAVSGPPEVTRTPRLTPIGDLRPGEYFCAPVSDDVWFVCWPGTNPDDYPKSNYYGVEQPPPRLDAVYAVNLTTGGLYLWSKRSPVRRAECRLLARVGE